MQSLGLAEHSYSLSQISRDSGVVSSYLLDGKDTLETGPEGNLY